jgi:quercetin 2,3-dioxygenase
MYLFVIEGEVKVGDVIAQRRDALLVTQTEQVSIALQKNTKILVIEVSL